MSTYTKNKDYDILPNNVRHGLEYYVSELVVYNGFDVAHAFDTGQIPDYSTIQCTHYNIK